MKLLNPKNFAQLNEHLDYFTCRSLIKGLNKKFVIKAFNNLTIFSPTAFQLQDMWIGGLKWSAYKFILLFLSFLIMPLVWVYVSSPFGFNRLHRVPIIKFMSYLAAHIFFIILITYTIVFPATKIYEYEDSRLFFLLMFLWFFLILTSHFYQV